MSGHHHHHHHEAPKGKKLLWVTILNLSITIVQVIGGLISNSLSLLSDALHNLADSSAIFIAYVAEKVGRKKPTRSKTFGYKRIEILAALFNGIVLISVSVYLFFEAYERFQNPEPIKGKLMLIIASFGLLANLISVVILNRDKAKNLNIKAAYMHLLGDTLSSVAVIGGGFAIWILEIYWIDPVITVLVGIYIIYHTWGIIKETVDILMQSTPDNIDLNKLEMRIQEFSEIENIHHVHIWKLDDRQIHLEAHISLNENFTLKEITEIQQKIEECLYHEFGISHNTLQVGYNCCDGNVSFIKNE